MLLKGSKLVTDWLLDVHGLNSYQRGSSRGPLNMTVVQWTAEAAFQTDKVTMATSHKAASDVGGMASVWHHKVIQASGLWAGPGFELTRSCSVMVDKSLSYTTAWSKIPSVLNLYAIHCTFGCIIEINQISDYLQKWTMFTVDCANLTIVSWPTVDKSDKNC